MLDRGQGARAIDAAFVTVRTKSEFYHVEALCRKRLRARAGYSLVAGVMKGSAHVSILPT
jgi:hypothetical protein